MKMLSLAMVLGASCINADPVFENRVEPVKVELSAPAESSLYGKVHELTHDNYESLLNQVGDDPTVIYTWATWCPPCMEFKPDFKRVAHDYGDRVNFFTLDYTEEEGQELDAKVDKMLHTSTDYVPALTGLRKGAHIIASGDFTYESASRIIDTFFSLKDRDRCE